MSTEGKKCPSAVEPAVVSGSYSVTYIILLMRVKESRVAARATHIETTTAKASTGPKASKLTRRKVVIVQSYPAISEGNPVKDSGDEWVSVSENEGSEKGEKVLWILALYLLQKLLQ
jgi:hypothetical protein